MQGTKLGYRTLHYPANALRFQFTAHIVLIWQGVQAELSNWHLQAKFTFGV